MADHRLMLVLLFVLMIGCFFRINKAFYFYFYFYYTSRRYIIGDFKIAAKMVHITIEFQTSCFSKSLATFLAAGQQTRSHPTSWFPKSEKIHVHFSKSNLLSCAPCINLLTAQAGQKTTASRVLSDDCKLFIANHETMSRGFLGFGWKSLATTRFHSFS